MSHRNRPRVSVVIVARDEQRKLPECLASLGWADEVVVVVDSASRDETYSIARRFTDRVIVRRFDTFARQRNAGLVAARGEWVFSIDADERVSPALAGELLSKVQDGRHAAYRVPIRSEILGRGFRFSGTQDDQPVRLFRRGSGGWVGAVHEVIEVAGTTGLLRHHLAHTTLENTRAFLNKIERYTTLEAWSLFKAGERFQAIDVCVRPFWVFSKLYIGKLGYRDGLEGFLFCVFSAVSVGIRAWKLREFERSARAREEKEWLAGRIEQARWVWNEGQSRRSA